MGKIFTTGHNVGEGAYLADYEPQKAFGIISPVEQAKWTGEANPCLPQKCTLNKPVKRKRRRH